MSDSQHQVPLNTPMFFFYEIYAEIGEIQTKLLSLQSRLLEAKQIIIKQEFEQYTTFAHSNNSEEMPIPF